MVSLPVPSAPLRPLECTAAPNSTKASFLFSTLDGTISGWNSKLGNRPHTPAISLIAVNNNAAGASYTGMAIINNAAGSFLVVPNFGTANKIEVYDSTFKPAILSGGTFTDPTLPSTYSPYGVHLIGSSVYVTYAVRSATAPFTPVGGLGNGIVSVFDTTGKYINRIVTGGNLNIPWGVAIAPANFGIFSNDLLIGNFGNGLINVYNPTTFAYLGQLTDGTGKPLTYATLWEPPPARHVSTRLRQHHLSQWRHPGHRLFHRRTSGSGPRSARRYLQQFNILRHSDLRLQHRRRYRNRNQRQRHPQVHHQRRTHQQLQRHRRARLQWPSPQCNLQLLSVITRRLGQRPRARHRNHTDS